MNYILAYFGENMKKSIRLASAIGALFVSTSMFAADASNSPAESLVKKLTDDKVAIVKTFPSIGNLVGMVVQPKMGQGQATILYVDKDGQYLVSGVVISAAGQNNSDLDTQTYILNPLAQKAFQDSHNTAWVLDGQAKAKHSIYVIADPNCTYCHKLYQETRPLVKNGDLAIRWIWVGFLKQSSPGIAQAILAAKDPQQAMQQNESGFDEPKEQGGLAPLATADKTVLEKYNKNMNFMNKYQFPVTPIILYKTQDGQIMSKFGMPTGKELTDLVNSASQLK